MESRRIANAPESARAPLTISVAIATYNRAAMVQSAIEAALAQSRAPVEVLVSDDASSDDTVQVVTRMARADARVKLLRQEANSGGVRNWNRAIEATCGELIAWCSDDDGYRAGHLEASAAYLEAHPEVGLVHSGFVDWIDTPEASGMEYRRLRFREAYVVDRRNLFRYLLRYYDWPFHPSTIVMRRRVWEETGPFDPAYALADTDWFVRAARKFPVAMLARYGVNNRRHLGNWSNRLGSARMQREIFEIVEKAIESAYGAAGLRKCLWQQAWRATARLHLLLTVRARLRTGYADAACAAWNAIFTQSVRSSSSSSSSSSWLVSRFVPWFVRFGEAWLRRRVLRRRVLRGGASRGGVSREAAAAADARQRVSPL